MKYITIIMISLMATSMFVGVVNGEDTSSPNSEAMVLLEKLYREEILPLLSAHNLTEGDESIKPPKYRPLLVSEDIIDFQDNFFIRGEIIPKTGFSTKESKTVVFAKEYMSCEIYLRKTDITFPSGYVPLKISLTYSKNQKGAFRSIFENMQNSSMGIEAVVRGYGKSLEYQLGELCLVRPSPERFTNLQRHTICFVRDCTAFVVLDNGNAGFDVSPLARFLDKRYKELTEELNNPPVLRQWKVPDEMEAKYMSSTDAEVTLEKKGGEIFKVELSKLSKQDQLYVQRRMEIATHNNITIGQDAADSEKATIMLNSQHDDGIVRMQDRNKKMEDILVQNAKEENRMFEIFRKFVLKEEDFSQVLENYQESLATPSSDALLGDTYAFIGKPDVLATDDKILFRQEIDLNNKVRILPDYMVLVTSDDAMKAVNYRISDTAWIAHGLSPQGKKSIGLSDNDCAFYYDEFANYILIFQCKNIVVNLRVKAVDDNSKTLEQMCHDLATIIIKRIRSNVGAIVKTDIANLSTSNSQPAIKPSSEAYKIEEQNMGESIDCIQMIRDKYSKNWNRIVVRPADSPEILCGTKTDDNSPKEYDRAIRSSHLLSKEVSVLILEDGRVITQNATAVGLYEKDGTVSKVAIKISLMNTPQSAQYHLFVLLKTPMPFTRPSELVMPQENRITTDFGTISNMWKTSEVDARFSEAIVTGLKKHCEYFWIFCDAVPNSGTFAIKNILVNVRGESDSIMNDEERKRWETVAKSSQNDIITLANYFASLFDDAPVGVVKEAPESQLTLRILERKDNECLASWQLTSNKEDALYGYWVRCDVSAGGIVIHEEKYEGKDDTIIRLERPSDEGKVLLSDIPAAGCILTVYGISPDGKTWYKKELEIPPSKSAISVSPMP